MLWKKANRFWKAGLIAISSMLLVHVSGCSDATPPVKTHIFEDYGKEKMMKICQELYAKDREKKQVELEVVRSIVNRFGGNGYSAVDSRNQIDMTEREQVIQFCELVDKKETGIFTIVEVTWTGEWVIWNLKTEDGNVDVVKSYCEYVNGGIQNVAENSYRAATWNYSEDGYLMLSGSWFSEEQYALTMSDMEEYTAFRVQPLDEKCRELNRKYLLPVSYERNNMFLVDWSEDDFGNLNMYDLFDMFYPKVDPQFTPDTADDNLGIDTIYQIPKEAFERVIMSYFNISSETLQSKTIYDPEDEAYEYKPRGFYEVEYPEYPYSEVVEYTENSDGTITLKVNVVFPYKGISKVFAHEVVVRPMEGGGVQYVSNRIIPSENNYDETWHTPRLTEEEWEELYGGE